MDMTTLEQARIAEAAGAVAVMALQATPGDIKEGRWSCPDANPEVVQQRIETVTIPVMAKTIVEAVNNYDNPAKLDEISKG